MKILLWALLLPISAWALNGPTVAPTGWDLYLQMGPNNNDGNNSDYVTTNGMSGGRFEGRLGSSSTASLNTNINLWCIDAQLYFNPNTAYRANSLGFDEINGEGTLRTGTQQAPSTPWAAGQRDVRYEDVGANSATSGDKFRNALGITLSNGVSDGALFRYRMAAFLLDQYESKSSNLATNVLLTGNAVGTGKYDAKNSTRNQNILAAIWTAMDTTGDLPDMPALGSISGGNAAFWYNQAATFVNDNFSNTAYWSKWRVVSGWSGTNYVRNSGGPVQTFLTETPEPGFYGLVAAGLGVLFMATRRRNPAAN